MRYVAAVFPWPRLLHAAHNLCTALWAPTNPPQQLQELAGDVNHGDDAPGTSSESARQRTRTGTLPEIKTEDVLPRAGSLHRFSEEAASLT